MEFVEFNPKRKLLVRAEHDSDLVQFITKLAEDRESQLHLRELEGTKLERKHDEETDLSLWDIE